MVGNVLLLGVVKLFIWKAIARAAEIFFIFDDLSFRIFSLVNAVLYRFISKDLRKKGRSEKTVRNIGKGKISMRKSNPIQFFPNYSGE